MTPTPLMTSVMNADRLELTAAGSWTAANADRLERLVDTAGSMDHVAFAAKILGDNGRIIGSRTFDALVPAPDLAAAGAAAAIDKAFANAVTDLVVLTASII